MRCGDPYCQVTTFFFPNGYCSEFCRAGGADAAECGPEGVCVSAGYIPGFEGLCRQRCEDDSDCQQGIDCLNVGGVKVCI